VVPISAVAHGLSRTTLVRLSDIDIMITIPAAATPIRLLVRSSLRYQLRICLNRLRVSLSYELRTTVFLFPHEWKLVAITITDRPAIIESNLDC